MLKEDADASEQLSFLTEATPYRSVCVCVCVCIFLGPISQTHLSLARYHFLLDLSPKIDLSLLLNWKLKLNLEPKHPAGQRTVASLWHICGM